MSELKQNFEAVMHPLPCGRVTAQIIREYVEHLEQTVHYQQQALDDKRRLTRELDVLLNGEEGAAAQASLCDIVAQVRMIKNKLNNASEPLEESEYPSDRAALFVGSRQVSDDR